MRINNGGFFATDANDGTDVFNWTNAIYVEGSNDLEYFLSYALADMAAVVINGQEVNPANYSYELVTGSVYKLTLSSTYLDTLGEGVYNLDIQTASQYASWLGSGVLPNVPYKFTIIPAGQTTTEFTYTKGSNTSLTYHIMKDFSLFENGAGNVMVDGVVIDPSNYTAVEGSTIITLLPAYLNSLAAGSHTIVANFSDGSSYSNKFFVMDANLVGPAGTNGIVPGAPSTGLRF
jgi:hypothetical protein